MTTLGIILSSARPHRVGAQVADWVRDAVPAGTDVDLIDLAALALPAFDEPDSPKAGRPRTTDHARAWAERIDALDAVVILTPQYNGSYPGALKNAIDYLSPELQDKAAAFVSYGGVGGARAVEHLRGILSQMQMAHVRATVSLSLFHDFEDFSELAPTEPVVQPVAPMLDQLLRWTRAMAAVRGGEFDAEDAAEAAA